MAIVIKTPSDVAEEYLLELKSLKPDVNTSQEDSDWWIRSRVVGGVVSGVYADQRLIANDAFPQRARHDALERFLDLYFESGFTAATNANGNAIVSGVIGSTVPAGMQLVYEPNGNVYTADDTTVLDAATASIGVTSVAVGQAQNLIGGASLNIPSAPAGIDNSATVDSNGLSDARDPETDSEARARILDRIRNPLSVGRESDYIQYAKEADTSVVTASVSRYPFGFGTVGVYITAGTTDIDKAVDEGETVNIIPSDELVQIVQDYLDLNRPVTDCVTVFKPTPIEIDVTVQVRYKQGDGSTILSGQTLTQEELVQREVKRAIYKTPVGGRVFDGSGYVLNSEIEETIDAGLSAEAVTLGKLEILLDRQVDDLAASGANLLILPSEAPTPGTITVVEM